MNRSINLNPDPDRSEVFKFTEPKTRRKAWLIEPMRFVKHSGVAS